MTRERREWSGGRFLSACWDMDELEAKKGEIVGGGVVEVSDGCLDS